MPVGLIIRTIMRIRIDTAGAQYARFWIWRVVNGIVSGLRNGAPTKTCTNPIIKPPTRGPQYDLAAWGNRYQGILSNIESG